MATITESGLFPPIIDSYLPGFNLVEVYQNGLTINFNISDYNDFHDISLTNGVHISIVRQSNYHHIFNTTNYPLGIYVSAFTPPAQGSTDTSINIPFEKFNLDEINYNEYYKVQVRFDNIKTHNTPYINPETGLPEIGAGLSNYLNDEQNLKCFSEWSTVCLIKFIAPPKIELYGNNEVILNPSGTNKITLSMLQLVGQFTKEDINITGFGSNLTNGKLDSSYLDSYSIQVERDGEVLFQSGELETDKNNPNSINYTIPFYFEPADGTEGSPSYVLKLNYTTSDLYEPPQPISYTLNVDYSKSAWNTQGNPVAETIALDSVIGKVAIAIESVNSEQDIPLGDEIMIRRGSDEDNFTIWDTVYSKKITSATKLITFDDFTIESGVIYKYEINYTNNGATPKPVTYSIVEGPVLSIFDHAFLTGEGTQLCVKFNPQISGFKRNVSDSVTTTIGGQFPYVDRNGSMYYRSFSLSGTIAYEMDVEHQFSSRTSIYGDWINVYGSYFVNHFYNQQNDRITQRKFRELVEAYLYDDVPKLFRSTPEGNILVRLTDVNLTPNNQLGRMIYDFSCTATEIGECTVDNYKLYKIQDFGDE